MRQRKNLSRGGMTLREEIKQKKGVATLYVVLRILVILVMVAQFLNGNFENVFLCILTLILFLVPTFIERKIRIDLPDTLEVIILLFIFAAEILGEIQAYYITFPYWDTMLHTLNGFLCAAIGFALVDILNRSERFSISLSPLFLALVAAIAVCFLLYIPRKKLSLTRFCDLAMHGFCNMIPTVAIIFFAFVMQEGMTEIGIAPFVINAVKPILSPAVFPAIAFLVVAALNFTTGSVWGITAVTVPILLPLAFSIGANPLLVMGAIVSGATLGSHACFYSDATVLTSSCCKMENMDHALSQLPYSLCAAGLSAAGYLVCGLLM